MSIETWRVVNAGRFTKGQQWFLDFHGNKVLLEAVP
jgi:hypothetical protein